MDRYPCYEYIEVERDGGRLLEHFDNVGKAIARFTDTVQLVLNARAPAIADVRVQWAAGPEVDAQRKLIFKFCAGAIDG